MFDMIYHWLYQLVQFWISLFFSPRQPPPRKYHSGPRVAVIGAGITGVSAAAHCVGHGCEPVIFEAGSRANLGGIWSRVNNTSSLQIHSVMYRFHPSVKFRKSYPDRKRILEEVTKVWKKYNLEERTHFNTRVEKIWKDENTGKWQVNERSFGGFDGIIAAVGTCGDPKMPHVANQEKFAGQIYHSSMLDDHEAKDKKVLVIGGGASAIEAIEWAVQRGAAKSSILARTDKWIIPRNPIVDGLLAMNFWGEETSLSWIPEFLLKRFFYRDLSDLAPTKSGIFTQTPMVNDSILDQIRNGQVQWLRGDIKKFSDDGRGIVFNRRAPGVRKGGPGEEIVVEGDICVMATGFHRPSLSFLPAESFSSPYEPPNWFLQAFPIGQPEICANNCTYINAIGTVGNIHIGIYTRFLLMFIMDPSTRPSEEWMRVWVDTTRIWKRGAPMAGLDYFTYSELMWWFIFSVAINPYRWRWVLFLLLGWQNVLPRSTRAKKFVNSETHKLDQYV